MCGRPKYDDRMKIRILVVIAAATATLAGCATGGGPARGGGSGAGAPKGVTYAGGDGASCEKRVVINGATNEMDGVAAEHAWLWAKYPGCKLKRQALIKCAEHPADQMSITTTEGSNVDVYFDISDFFGKGFE
jgi:hypothetical protein